MAFTTETATIKHNYGMSKADVDQGFERLDDQADNKVFGKSIRDPKHQGWHDAPPMMMESAPNYD